MNRIVRIKVSGNNPKYFLNRLISNSITYSNLKIYPKYIIFDTNYSNYKKIIKFKTYYKILFCGYVGKFKYIYFIYRYWYFFLFYVLSILFLIFLSKLIFNIEVVHNNSYIKEIVISDLKKYNISKFKFKVSYKDKEKIINKILEEERDDIEWMEIIEDGTKYIVNVEQRKKNNDSNKCNDRHIVAKKDAMITFISADNGEIVAKKYDYVKKGDVLISGFIHNKDKITSKKCASGLVMGEVWYIVNIELPLFYSENVYTNKIHYGFEFDFLTKNISLFNNFKKYNKNRYFLLNNSLSPIMLTFNKFSEFKENNIYFDINNIENIVYNKAINCLKNKLDGKYNVIDKKVLKKEQKESKIIVDVFIKVEEDITDYFDITDIDINTENIEE